MPSLLVSLRRAAVGLACVSAVAHAQGSRGILAGSVIDTASHPVVGATIAVEDTPLHTTTDSTGRFVLRDVPAGPQLVQVTRRGYVTQEFEVQIEKDVSLSVTWTLQRASGAAGAEADQPAEPAASAANGKPARLAGTTRYDGFYARRQSLKSGVFLTHEDIEATGKTSLRDILETVQGVRVRQSSAGRMIALGGCGPGTVSVYLDGDRVVTGTAQTFGNDRRGGGGGRSRGGSASSSSGPDPLEFVDQLTARDVEAIEVYRTAAELPPDLHGDACGVVIVWRR